jgi:hypothetical protein
VLRQTQVVDGQHFLVANALNQVEPRQAKLKIRQVVIKEKQVPLVKKSSTEAPNRK